ncbi:hypothetical protein VUS97_26790, partial [Pseudomonas aeruginosa]|uniref:hypothetical protein n=1 Tax=Pseudomonas aeruginosa TaxID=287 RepID=UPI0030049C52
MGAKSFYGYLKLGVGQLYAGSIGQHESHCNARFVHARVLAVLPPEIIVASIEAWRPQKLSATPDHFGKVLP